MAYWPTRTDISFSEGAIEDIKLLVEFAGRLPDIVEASKQESHEFVASKAIRKLSEKLKIEYRQVFRLFNALENFKIIADEVGGPEKAIDQVIEGLDAEVAERMEAGRDSIVRALVLYDDNNPISISYKAQKITYLRDKLFHDVEIMTDARPVFDAEGVNILEMVITHTLVITYWTRSGWETAHIAADAVDMLHLRKVCDRAIIKAKTLKTALEEKWPTEVLRDDAGT
jgi:hypothetical protein